MSAYPVPASAGPQTRMIPIADISEVISAFPRTRLSESVIEEYADLMEDGAAFPPIEVFSDGDSFILADGFLRFRALLSIGRQEAECTVMKGGQSEARLRRYTANARHPVGYTKEEKTDAVEAMLKDPKWSLWSSRAIARHCGVSEKTVRNRRSAVSAENPQIEAPRTVSRGGTTYQMNTSHIGKSLVAPAPAAQGDAVRFSDHRLPSVPDDAERPGVRIYAPEKPKTESAPLTSKNFMPKKEDIDKKVSALQVAIELIDRDVRGLPALTPEMVVSMFRDGRLPPHAISIDEIRRSGNFLVALADRLQEEKLRKIERKEYFN